MTDHRAIVEQLRELEKKATAGEWEAHRNGVHVGIHCVAIGEGETREQRHANAALIAAMRNALPALLTRLDEFDLAKMTVRCGVRACVKSHEGWAMISKDRLDALERVAEAARALAADYKELADSGDCGNWTCEDDVEEYGVLMSALAALEVTNA